MSERDERHSNGFKPLVIIGAARSGTNMLRDILTSLPQFTTWPCDEINYVWRHGNVRHPSDELRPEQARPSVRAYVRSAFARIGRRKPGAWVVEKTCANSLRVEFVDRIVPEARFVEIVRDGRDVVVSAELRWSAALEIQYLAKKARYLPLLDVPYYATRYLWNRIYRCFSTDERLAFWGPRFEGMDEALETHSLQEVCALQWQRSVERSREALEKIEPERVHRLRYEDFVADPLAELRSLLDFADVDPGVDLHDLVGRVSAKSVGQWRRKLDAPAVTSIEALIGGTLSEHGYTT
jgi:hypothetical protein